MFLNGYRCNLSYLKAIYPIIGRHNKFILLKTVCLFEYGLNGTIYYI